MIPFDKWTQKHAVYSMPVQVRGEAGKIWLILKKEAVEWFCFFDLQTDPSWRSELGAACLALRQDLGNLIFKNLCILFSSTFCSWYATNTAYVHWAWFLAYHTSSLGLDKSINQPSVWTHFLGDKSKNRCAIGVLLKDMFMSSLLSWNK